MCFIFDVLVESGHADAGESASWRNSWAVYKYVYRERAVLSVWMRFQREL